MMNVYFVANLLKPYQPQMPLDQLVIEVNKLYHACEAQDYDSKHPKLYAQLPELWQEMIQIATAQCRSTVWRILDFGCGTGFEAEQLLRNLSVGNVAQLVCYDPSPEMLNRCRSRVAPLYPQAVFCGDLRDLPAGKEGYNLLATNSLLHHLPDPVATMNNLRPLLAPESVWLAGHEPSNRFYKNAECLKVYERFLRERSWRKFLSPERYFYRLRIEAGLISDPAKQAANEAFRKGLFKRKPSKDVIGTLVDFHVPCSVEEATAGRGFDFELLQQDFAGSWHLRWVKTYSYVGSFYENYVPEKWVRSCAELARKFPQDGANFCSIWKRP